MSKVSHWFKHLAEFSPLDTTCNVGIYKDRTWREVCQQDPDWILDLITASRVLLDSKLEKQLLNFLRKKHRNNEGG